MEQSEKQFNDQVASYWTWVAMRKELGYWNIPGWQEHQNLLASGNPNTSWIDVVGNQLLATQTEKTALSLGCGDGFFERLFLKKGLCTCVEACDISPHLVEVAQETANKQGLPITYFVQDLNHPSFTPQKYDLIIAAGILHHIKNLEILLPNIQQALKKDGKFIVYDYVGPSRFQWTPKQIERCNYWLQQLPKKYKKKRGYPWYYYPAKRFFDLIPFAQSSLLENVFQKTLPARAFAQWKRLQRAQLILNDVVPPSIEQFLVTDPSEAIRSEEIIPLIERNFKIEKIIPQGGSLAQPLFGRTVANFIDDSKGIEFAKKVLADERQQILSGSLRSDFVAFISTPIVS